MNSDLKITLSRVLEKPLQINGTDTETHYINELFKRLVFHELLNKLNLKSLYHYRDNVKYCPGKVELNFTLNKQELDLLINQITSMDNVQKTYIILQPWLQDLNKGEQEEQIFVYLIDINWEEDQIDEILDQIWGIEEELELDKDLILLPNFPYINTYLEDYKYLVIYESPKYILLQDIPNQLYDYLEQIELFPFQGYSTTYQELEYNYNYHIIYRTQRLKIQNQIEQESQQLIKNLILSNQINNVTPTQIKIQF